MSVCCSESDSPPRSSWLPWSWTPALRTLPVWSCRRPCRSHCRPNHWEKPPLTCAWAAGGKHNTQVRLNTTFILLVRVWCCRMKLHVIITVIISDHKVLLSEMKIKLWSFQPPANSFWCVCIKRWGSYHQRRSGSVMSSGELAGSWLRNRVEADRAQVSSHWLLEACRRLTAGRRRTTGALLQQRGNTEYSLKGCAESIHTMASRPPPTANR